MGLFSDWRHGNEIRLAIMFLLTTIYFVIEIFVGYSSNCMALVADSFHMLSDVVALAVAFGAVVIAPKQWSKSTFGWARAEVLGALINSVFLLALCFSILMESLKRFYAMEPIDNPFLVFVVGLVGLGVNLIGLAIFGGHVHHGHDHGHGHAGHSHGHAHHGHSHKQHKHGDSHPGEKHRHGQDKSLPVLAEAPCDIAEHEVLNIGVRRPSLKAASMRGANAYVLMDGVASLADLSKTQCQQEYCDEELAEKVRESTKIVIESTHASMKKVDSPNGALAGSHQFIRSSSPDQEKKHNHSNMNMHGVFLHVLGDALGSVIVVISAAVFYWTDWEYRFYLDPVLSIIMTIIITRSTIPLLKESCLILLQTFPSHLDLGGIKEALATIDGIHGVHELHVWRLTCDRVIASAHITFTSLEAYHKAGSEVKKVFHNEGIYSTTIQPEVLEIQEETILAYNSEKGFGGVCATGKPCELREFPQDAGKNAEERKKSSRKVQNGNLAAHPLGQIEGGGSLNARPTWPQKHTVVKNGRVVTSSANHEQASDSFGSAGCVLTAVVPLNDEENERLPSHGNHTLVVNGLPPSGAVTAPDGNATDGEKISTLKDHSDRKSAA